MLLSWSINGCLETYTEKEERQQKEEQVETITRISESEKKKKKKEKRGAYTATTNTSQEQDRIDNESKSARSFLSAIVVTQIPSSKLLKTRLKISGRLITKLPLRRTDVSMSERHIPIPRHLHNVPLRLHFQKPLKDSDEISHRNRGSVSKIKNPQLSRTTLLTTTPSALLRRVQSPQTPFHNIVNVSKIPSHRPVVRSFKHRDSFPFENIPREKEVRHVRSPPRTVNREKPQTG